jgi:gliding motility-associated lipoprotein GldD
MIRYFKFIIFLSLITGCRPETYIPKPPGYYKLDTPAQHQYRVFDQPGFPYTFEYPVYCQVYKDTIYASKKNDETRYWVNLSFPELGGIINLTYKDITLSQPLDKLNAESFEMSFFHHEKAAYMDHTEFLNGDGTDCLIYTIGGNVATRYQFTATDTTKHFLRGALYFDVTPNADSLKPASDFIERDIEHLLLSLKWKK